MIGMVHCYVVHVVSDIISHSSVHLGEQQYFQLEGSHPRTRGLSDLLGKEECTTSTSESLLSEANLLT